MKKPKYLKEGLQTRYNWDVHKIRNIVRN